MTSTRILLRVAVCAAALASSALAQAEVPAGKIGINYNRCDNNYDGWGLHIWKNPGIPLPGVEWPNPMQPTGKNDFGIFWQTDDNQFGSTGTVNYIIHKGDNKEQGGRDMKFEGKEHKEIWVNSGDRKIYFSLEDAKKAREEKPCQ